MHLSAAILTTATVCCTGSVTVYWRNSRLSRMQQRMLWLEPHPPVLQQLHWLLVRQQIIFKLAMITYKCPQTVHGLAPSYLADVSITLSPFHPSPADTHSAAYKDYHQSARLCCVGPGDMEQPPCQTVEFNFFHRDIYKKLKSHLSGW